MRRIKSSLIACVMFAGSVHSYVAFAAEAPDPSLAAVLSAKQRLARKPLDERENEILLSWGYALSKHDTPTGVMGVVSLWNKGHRSLVELVWWRQRDPVVRKSILLLYYGLTKVELDGFPSFEDYAARFEAVESASRKKEIDEVKALLVKDSETLLRAFPQSPH